LKLRHPYLKNDCKIIERNIVIAPPTTLTMALFSENIMILVVAQPKEPRQGMAQSL
jgi:hypothetical protein